MRFQGSTFVEETIQLDFNEFEGCTFKRCRIVYAGSGTVRLAENTFEECRFEFVEAAGRTLEFMAALYAGGGGELIEGTFDQIREQAGVRHG